MRGTGDSTYFVELRPNQLALSFDGLITRRLRCESLSMDLLDLPLTIGRVENSDDLGEGQSLSMYRPLPPAGPGFRF